MELDEALTTFLDEFEARLGSLNVGRLRCREMSDDPGALELLFEDTNVHPLDTDGTLILAVRYCDGWDDFQGLVDPRGNQVQDRHGCIISGGMIFIEGFDPGAEASVIDVGNQCPTKFLEAFLLATAHKEFDRTIPGVVTYFEERNLRYLEHDRKVREVQARSQAILTRFLDPQQLAEFQESKSFHVRGADGHLYLITSRNIHNVFRIEDGRRTHEYCIISPDVPVWDQMLTQLLLLQSNPEEFHRVTNTWTLTESGERVFHRPEQDG